MGDGKRAAIDRNGAQDAAGWGEIILSIFSHDQSYTVTRWQQGVYGLKFHEHRK